MSFNALHTTLSDLFNSRTIFKIPSNQRRYVWEEVNWRELREDIWFIANKSARQEHFMGSIVLMEEDSIDGVKCYTIIDGQQRVTTSIAILIVLAYIFRDNDRFHDFDVARNHLRTITWENKKQRLLDPLNYWGVDQMIQPLLDEKYINKKNDFMKFLNRIDSSNLDDSLRKCFLYYYDTFTEELNDGTISLDQLKEFRNRFVSTGFVKIVASSEKDSYTIFEILNARGQNLEHYELLKNYIMRYIDESEHIYANQQWNTLLNRLNKSELKHFIQHYTVHKFAKYKPVKDTYRLIRQQTGTMDKMVLLNDILLKSSYYREIVSPELKEGYEDEYMVLCFFKEQNQRLFRPVLLSLMNQLKENNISKDNYVTFLKQLYEFYVCYTLIGKSLSNRLSSVISTAAFNLEQNFTYDTLDKLKLDLFKKLPGHESFSNVFANLGYSNNDKSPYNDEGNKEIVRLVIEIIERSFSSERPLGKFTIEHILPDSASVENGNIGNLLPLENSLNRLCENLPIEKKIPHYLKSQYAMTVEFAKRFKKTGYEFDPRERAKHMANSVRKSLFGNNRKLQKASK